MNRVYQSFYSGLQSYLGGLKLQSEALACLQSGESTAIVIGLEHEPVVTLGVRGRSDADLVVGADGLASKGFQLHETQRGGQATLHSPGQLVIYPCVNLKAHGLGARSFVDLVQATTSEWLKNLGIEAIADAAEPGLYVDGQKIAAFGFKIARGLTSHGIAINVSNELSYFSLIRTCGVRGQKVTRLCDQGVNLGLEALFLSWSEAFEANLSLSTRTELLDGRGHVPLV